VSLILVVDDNRDLAENMREILEETGASVVVAHDARASFDLIAERVIDLALIDVNLPQGSGIDVVRALKERSPDAEAVLVTGDATIDSAIEAVRHGVFAYVQKPFDPNGLIGIAERALAQVSLRRERAELALELARSEALYRDVVDSVYSILVGLDREHHVRMWNRTAAEITGWSAAEALGRSACEILFEPDDRAAFDQALRGGDEIVLPMRVREGAPRVVRWRVAQLTESNGALAVGEDVTERRALEARAAEAEALAAMGRLTAGLAHEIRNPLNAATLQLELMSRAAARVADPEARDALDRRGRIVRAELTRLTQLLDEFLSLARPQHLDASEIDVVRLLEDLALMQAPAAEAAGVALSVERDPDTPHVRGNEAKLKQAIVNLIVNAVDAMRARGSGRVVLSSRVEGDRVELRVEDDGPGLPALDRRDLFRAFVTTKERGTGLGLAIVKQIVDFHGGSIELSDRAGGGTVARVWLPRGKT
jgi:PAS domain S-box-containing protein